MKPRIIKALTLISLLWGTLAMAAPQTHLCASNMDDLRVIIQNHFPNYGPNYTKRFVGRWVGTINVMFFQETVPLKVKPHERFVLNGGPIYICPQQNNTFFVYSATDRSKTGYFKLSAIRNRAHLLEATGEWAQASGSLWVRTEAAAQADIPADQTDAAL